MTHRFRQHSQFWIAILLFLLVLFVRVAMLPFVNPDVGIFLRWITYLEAHGYGRALKDAFSNYPPAYLYVLSFFTFLLGRFSNLAVIKIMPLVFDLYATLVVFKIARLKFPYSDRPFLLAAVFFGLPTVVINSSGWGQVDSLYGAFLLTCVYLVLVERPLWAVLAFAIAFSFKSQSIFLLPFLGIMVLKGRIPWAYFLLVPLVYLVLAIPVVLLGRPWQDILTLYLAQASQFPLLSYNAPNPYIFFNGADYRTGVITALLITLAALVGWARLSLRARQELDRPAIAWLALTSVALVPFFLPLMHERYFYAADLLSFVAVIFMPQFWFVALFYQLISGLSYTAFLLNSANRVPLIIATALNTITLAFLLWKQFALSNETISPPPEPAPLPSPQP